MKHFNPSYSWPGLVAFLTGFIGLLAGWTKDVNWMLLAAVIIFATSFICAAMLESTKKE